MLLLELVVKLVTAVRKCALVHCVKYATVGGKPERPVCRRFKLKE